MKRRWKWTVGIVALVVGVGGAWWVRRKPAGPVYSEVTVARDTLRTAILTTGEVRPRNRLLIKPPIAGRAESILVREGDAVKKGQILAWMSSTERAALLDAARAKGSAELARWEDLYKPTPLVAPVAGLVIARNVEPGQTVTAADAVLIMSDRLILKAQVDETDVGQVRLGQPVRIVLDAYPREPQRGRVEHIAFEAKTVNNVTIYEVDVLPEDVPAFMRSGMTANLTFRVAEKENALVLPVSAVKGLGETATVRVPGPGREPEERTVRTGLSDGKRVEILEGLTEGDRVLVAGGTAVSTAAKESKSNPLSPMPRRPGGNRRR
ncbi:MAG: HlyD family efflux transporter periplasmic adaptor subunit [Elusimicrobia bacterium]|jgi:macrolide-specific efflux system membrane fusion protein|nr:MAG: HlyD family efflux transporter periplasmic adaptor subunit [Elusimicrobiota bacterium]